jgi:hypothetical protein
MKIELIQEICCEVCNDGIHVHIKECPSCKKSYTPSSIYGNIGEMCDVSEIPEFSCESCKTLFRATKTLKEIQRAEGIHYTEWNIV